MQKVALRRPIHSGNGFKNEVSVSLRTKNGVKNVELVFCQKLSSPINRAKTKFLDLCLE